MNLLHELTGNIQQSTKSTRAPSTLTTATRLALHVELQRHLRRLRNSILLRSRRMLNIISQHYSTKHMNQLTVFP